ncbi:peptidoglycan-binding protein [Rhodococcoides fascians]|uniref:peptidoglycan-binding protein n=1 Tax=Rhodococcoides fascians TaxID=1828 RepID=UPI000522E51A|nr:peptidoglycan-binding protein [Rhodococcus fascians]
MSFRRVYGNDWSENGWRMCDRNECEVVRTAPFMDTAPLRKGAPAVILGSFAAWLHNNVRPFTSPVWGWSVTNDVKNSNHLAGTAFDAWAPIRPWGRRTMPRNEIDKVNEGLRIYPEVFWGAVWNKPDEMHFQMRFREGDARNDAGVRRILDGFVPGPVPGPAPAPSGRPTLMRGSTGDQVRYLQGFLNRAYRAYSNLAVDGDFGPATEAVVREFQSRKGGGLAVDGVVGPATWRALGL